MTTRALTDWGLAVLCATGAFAITRGAMHSGDADAVGATPAETARIDPDRTLSAVVAGVRPIAPDESMLDRQLAHQDFQSAFELAQTLPGLRGQELMGRALQVGLMTSPAKAFAMLAELPLNSRVDLPHMTKFAAFRVDPQRAFEVFAPTTEIEPRQRAIIANMLARYSPIRALEYIATTPPAQFALIQPTGVAMVFPHCQQYGDSAQVFEALAMIPSREWRSMFAEGIAKGLASSGRLTEALQAAELVENLEIKDALIAEISGSQPET